MAKHENPNTKRHQCKITFRWDDGDETKIVNIYTPRETNDDDIKKALRETHDYLCLQDETDIYGTAGRTPETLVDYLCEQKGWSWTEHQESNIIEITLD